jgi:hypothetical protein
MFYQLYTIHAKVDGQIMPLAFGLLSKKSRRAYDHFFEGIRDAAEQRNLELNLLTFRSDFERAAMDSAFVTYDLTSVEGCFFHFAQANWRKVQGLKLQTLYATDHEFSMNIRMLTALAFVPVDDVQAAFEEIALIMPDEAEEYVDYFRRTWVGYQDYAPRMTPEGRLVVARGEWHTATFPPRIWNVYDRVINDEPRTPNHLEGWHRRFEVIVGKAHPNIFEFLERVQDEQAHIEYMMDQLEVGNEPSQSRLRVKSMNKRVKRVTMDYANRPLDNYLRSLAHNISY